MADHDRDGRFLDRFWDDLTSSEAADPGNLDPDTAAIIRRLHALAAPPIPTSAHDRVWRRVTSSTGHRVHSKELNLMTTTDLRLMATPGFMQPRLVSPNGQAPASAPSRGLRFGTITSQHRWLAILVSAALIVLTLGVVFGPLRPGQTGPADRGGIPGAMFAASPSPDAQTLFEITVPGSAMPPMGRGAAVLFSMTGEPYFQGVYAGNPCCPGILVVYMIDGTYTVRPELGSITVYRAGLTAAPEEIDTGTSVELGPGDVLLAEKNAFVRFSNYAGNPVTFLTWQLLTDNFASDPTGPGFPTGWSWTGRNADGKYKLSLPAADATMRLEQITVAEGEIMPVPAGAIVQVVEVDIDDPAGYIQRADGSIFGLGEGSATVYVLMLLPGAVSATPEA